MTTTVDITIEVGVRTTDEHAASIERHRAAITMRVAAFLRDQVAALREAPTIDAIAIDVKGLTKQ